MRVIQDGDYILFKGRICLVTKAYATYLRVLTPKGIRIMANRAEVRLIQF